MSKFQQDLNQEHLLSQYLDSIYTQRGLDFERIHDSEKQHRGIDVLLRHKDKTFCVDEKAQLHYLNADLPTFTFELSYLNREGQRKKGWLFDEGKQTDYYFLVTGIFTKSEGNTLRSPDDIARLKITSVNRSAMVAWLAAKGLTEAKLSEYDTALRQAKHSGKKSLPELQPSTEGLLYATTHLQEKPINLQLRLSCLIDEGVAKRLMLYTN